MSSVDITVVADAEEAARLVAERLAEQARAGGSVVLTGGSTPRRAYEIAAELEPDWSRVELWWGDERCVPPDDERSNYAHGEGGAARPARTRACRRPPHAGRARPRRGHGGVRARARRTSASSTSSCSGSARTVTSRRSSPDFPTLDVTDRDVVGSEAGHEPFVDRISLTLPRLCDTRELLFLVAGEDKADAVARALAGEPSHETPGSLARAADGATRAVLDRAAAAKL